MYMDMQDLCGVCLDLSKLRSFGNGTSILGMYLYQKIIKVFILLSLNGKNVTGILIREGGELVLVLVQQDLNRWLNGLQPVVKDYPQLA
tara:strand:+ start:304 stop:570 length:267 start_codon:yes stop_codon:yes gene_type:complete